MLECYQIMQNICYNEIKVNKGKGGFMYHTFCILIGKIIILIGKILKRGSSLPGAIILKLDKKILHSFTLPKIVIAVTGSSGKGSTSSLITAILKEQGLTVAHNKAGSNLTPGILTLLLENCNLKGILKCDALVYEVDERYAKYLFHIITPSYVVISNVSRDQPPRQGHFDLVFHEIEKAITPSMHLILNADDPYLQKFVIGKKNPVSYYSISKNKYSYTTNKFMNLNLNYCPKCNHKLEYHYYNFETCGEYYCSNCKFKKPKCDVTVTKIDYSKSTILINDTYSIHLPYTILYDIYNTLAAFTITSLLNLKKEKICESLSHIHKNEKLFDVLEEKGRIVTILNNKNENSSTFNQSLLYVSRFKEEKIIVIGWKEISRRYQFDDLSWLYDIDFELLNKLKVQKVICVGIHRYDIATRLKYAGMDEKNILVFEKLTESTDYIKHKTKHNIYAILNFDYVEPFKKEMAGEENDHPYRTSLL